MHTGRWTILRRATPSVQRPASEPSRLRPRVHVRCVCGHERIVWLGDIEQGRSTGCSSPRCRARWLACADLRAFMLRRAQLDRRALLQACGELGPRARRVMERLAEDMHVMALAAIDADIAAYLASPHEDPLDQGEAVG